MDLDLFMTAAYMFAVVLLLLPGIVLFERAKTSLATLDSCRNAQAVKYAKARLGRQLESTEGRLRGPWRRKEGGRKGPESISI